MVANVLRPAASGLVEQDALQAVFVFVPPFLAGLPGTQRDRTAPTQTPSLPSQRQQPGCWTQEAELVSTGRLAPGTMQTHRVN